MSYNKLLYICERCEKVLDTSQMLNNDEDAPFYDDNYGARSVPYVSICCYAPVVEEWSEE